MYQNFTSEAVSEGHPDKVCDQISDAIVDLYLSRDNLSRCAIETLATTNRVIIAGETSCNSYVSSDEIEQTIRNTIRQIGYDQKGFSWQTVKIDNYLHHQSCDIALGVDRDGAGDQGIMFGYAKKEKGFDSNYMPLAIYWANRILQNLSNARHNGEVIGIEPDAKSQVTLEYDNNGTPIRVKTIVLSTQHHDSVSQETIREIAKKYIAQTLPDGWMPTDDNILVNPTGRFVIGGPDGDTGLTGRKSLSTHTAVMPHTAAAHFPAKIRPRLTVRLLICCAIWQKILLPPAWLKNASCKFHTQSVWLNRCLYILIPTTPIKLKNNVSSILFKKILT